MSAEDLSDVRFVTCYPCGPEGKLPCGAAVVKRSFRLKALICPGVSESDCSALVDRWNAEWAENVAPGMLEEALGRFMTDALGARGGKRNGQ